MRMTRLLAPTAAAFRRPPTPGTVRPSRHFGCARFKMYTWLVMSSQVLRGPTPIREIISRPSPILTTALPETAAGMEGMFFGSSAANRAAAHSMRGIRTGDFFIAEILILYEFEEETRLCSTGSVSKLMGRRRVGSFHFPFLRTAGE